MKPQECLIVFRLKHTVYRSYISLAISTANTKMSGIAVVLYYLYFSTFHTLSIRGSCTCLVKISDVS